MAEIKPFKALLYDKDKIGGDYAEVMAPPYDVIPANMQEELYNKNPYNVIRLILGKDMEGDDEKNNKYIRAKNILKEWQQQGVMAKNCEDTFYVYLQEYEHDGNKCRRVGFMGLLKMGEPGNDAVLPHEYTLAKPKEDRMNLIKQVEGNLSPIFALYDDKGAQVKEILEKGMSSSDPAIDVSIDGISHRIWRISDKDDIEKIVSLMEDRKTFIADGHHRYEVARMYRDMKRKDPAYDGSADYIMMYFTDMTEQANLTVMATHRVIKDMQVSGDDDLTSKLEQYFDIEKYDDLSGLMERLKAGEGEDHNFGSFIGKKYFLLKPKNDDDLRGLITEDKTPEWKKLDVSVLHSAVLEKILGIGSVEGNITYVRDAEKGDSLVKEGSHTAAFFLNPTKVDQIKAVAELGEMMPQKSTYFYPKLLSGLTINTF